MAQSIVKYIRTRPWRFSSLLFSRRHFTQLKPNRTQLNCKLSNVRSTLFQTFLLSSGSSTLSNHTQLHSSPPSFAQCHLQGKRRRVESMSSSRQMAFPPYTEAASQARSGVLLIEFVPADGVSGQDFQQSP